MVAYLGWLIAFASWGVQSFWVLIPLAMIATFLSVLVLSVIMTTIGGVSLDPVSERGTLPIGETRDPADTRGGETAASAETQEDTRIVRWVLTRPVFVERSIVLALALFIFAIDWSGFNKWNPDLFSPKSFRDVWWHFPIIWALVFSAKYGLTRNDRADK